MILHINGPIFNLSNYLIQSYFCVQTAEHKLTVSLSFQNGCRLLSLLVVFSCCVQLANYVENIILNEKKLSNLRRCLTRAMVN